MPTLEHLLAHLVDHPEEASSAWLVLADWLHEHEDPRWELIRLRHDHAYHMHGNVCEWCSDWSGEYSSHKVVDPQGPEEGSGRVARGGGWAPYAGYCRAAYRYRSTPDDRNRNVGIRLARVPSG